MAFKQFLEVDCRAFYIIAGGISGKINIKKYIEDLGIAENVLVTGYVNMDTFNKVIQSSDILINLRQPSIQGETSASLLRIMSLGKPAIISNFNQYRDFPEDICIKIDIDQRKKEVESIYSSIVDLYSNPGKRDRIGRAAKKYVTEHHNWDTASDQYINFAKELFE